MVMERVFPVIAQFGWAFIVGKIFHETYIFTPAIKYSFSKNTSAYLIGIKIYLLWDGCTIQEPTEYAMAYLPSADV